MGGGSTCSGFAGPFPRRASLGSLSIDASEHGIAIGRVACKVAF